MSTLPRLEDVFERLQRSAFRSRFRLNEADRRYFVSKGLETVLSHGREFIGQRLAPAAPPNDGKQTPMRGHPIFVAQHASATCCRSCLTKWHGIPAGRPLSTREQEHVLAAITFWLRTQPTDAQDDGRQGSLF